jgi:hypothetical protein
MTPARNLDIVIVVMVASACWPVIVVMMTPVRTLVIVVTIATARRPVIAVMVTPARRGGFVVIATLARSSDLAGMLVALSAHALPRGGVNLHVDPVVQRDAIGQHAGLAVEVDLGDVGSSLPLQSDLLCLDQIDGRLQ